MSVQTMRSLVFFGILTDNFPTKYFASFFSGQRLVPVAVAMAKGILSCKKCRVSLCIISGSQRSPMVPLARHARWEDMGSSCSNGQLCCRPWRSSWRLSFLSARLRLQHSSRGVVWMGIHNQQILWSSQRWCPSHRRRWYHTIHCQACFRRVRVEQRSWQMAEASLNAKSMRLLPSHHSEEQALRHGQRDVQGHRQNHNPGDGLPGRCLVRDHPVVNYSRQGELWFDQALPYSVGWFHHFWPTRCLRHVIRSK